MANFDFSTSVCFSKYFILFMNFVLNFKTVKHTKRSKVKGSIFGLRWTKNANFYKFVGFTTKIHIFCNYCEIGNLKKYFHLLLVPLIYNRSLWATLHIQKKKSYKGSYWGWLALCGKRGCVYLEEYLCIWVSFSLYLTESNSPSSE